LLSDRQSDQARDLFVHLAEYTDRRLLRLVRVRYANLLTEAQREELVGEVLYELMSGALASFRGQSIGELTAYVRCICDRMLWRTAQKQIRERDTLAESGVMADVVRAWNGDIPGPSDNLHMQSTNPLDATDSGYLLRLLEAGSRAEFARSEGVSRAAVTQRVQRIKRRISELSTGEQDAAEAWFAREAERVSARRSLSG
jgi:hypothetical protein